MIKAYNLMSMTILLLLSQKATSFRENKTGSTRDTMGGITIMVIGHYITNTNYINCVNKMILANHLALLSRQIRQR